MKSAASFFSHVSLLFVAFLFSLPAQAAYTFTIVQYPGAAATELWGVNNSGQIVGQAFPVDPNAPTINFLYSPNGNVFTTLASVPGEQTGVTGINDSGVMVGSVFDSNGIETGFVRSTKGKFTMFSYAAPEENTEPRAINDSGLVTGFAYDDSGDNTIGFIYDSAPGNYTNLPFVGSPQVIPQGINASGVSVGSVVLPDSGQYSGFPLGVYGFLRDTNGAITLFQVNGVGTRARGINDAGQITGWTRHQGPGNHASGFVGTLTGSFLPLIVPGATDTTPQAINNAGRIVGSTESDGFIATPVATDKDQCKGGGWQSLSRADGTFFKNQGDCIQYVNTGK